MDTKIDRVSLQPQPALTPQSGKSGSDIITASSAPPLKLPEPKKDSNDDSVKLTAAAKELSQTEKSGNTAPVDAKRVQAIKRSVEEGTYHVEPKRVAAKFAAAEGEKLSRRIG